MRMDGVTRAAVLTRIRYLADAYQLQWLPQQATFAKGKLSSLDDGDLAGLLRDMERARECSSEDVSFDDANLVRNTSAILEMASFG